VKSIIAFIKLVRWPNLVFVALTQILFHYCIVWPVFKASNAVPLIHGQTFWFVTVAYILIAAAGYVINDYFDLNIDQVNKPDKVIVARVISRRWVILWHILLSAVAVGMCVWVDVVSQLRIVSVGALMMVALLFLYSTSLKKRFLIGNVLIAAIIAWGILMFTLYEFIGLHKAGFYPNSLINHRLLRYTYLYAGFAFIITIIREVVKDMEDMEGDRRYGCKTMPIVWGLTASKVFVAVWLIVLLATLLLVQIYVMQYGWWWSIAYAIVALIVPIIWVFKQLFPAHLPIHFKVISKAIKWIMLAGIASMLFFKWFLD